MVICVLRFGRSEAIVKILKHGKVADQKVAIVLPHELFSFLYGYNRELWEHIFLNAGENERFWRWCEDVWDLDCVIISTRPYPFSMF